MQRSSVDPLTNTENMHILFSMYMVSTNEVDG